VVHHLLLDVDHVQGTAGLRLVLTVVRIILVVLRIVLVPVVLSHWM
jgi:hypothetical protein